MTTIRDGYVPSFGELPDELVDELKVMTEARAAVEGESAFSRFACAPRLTSVVSRLIDVRRRAA